jgi:hypothetical protein
MVLPITGAESYVSETGKSMKVEAVAATVSFDSEAEANLFGLHWQPLYELKLAAMQGLEGLADYAPPCSPWFSTSRRFFFGWRRSSPEPPGLEGFASRRSNVTRREENCRCTHLRVA